MGRLLLAILMLALAGCAAPSTPGDSLTVDPATQDPSTTGPWTPDPWTRLPCDPSGATTIGQNAPLVPGLSGTEAEVARRVAQAFGQTLVSETTALQGGFSRWQTTTGYVQSALHYGIPAWEVWTSNVSFPSVARLHAGLAALGASESSWRLTSDREAHQFWQGERLRGSTAGFSTVDEGDDGTQDWGTFYMQRLSLLPGPLELRDEEELLATAKAFDRCLMDAEGFTAEAGYETLWADFQDDDVHHGSLVREAIVRYSYPGEPLHCGYQRAVVMDVVTGAVHGPVGVGCD